MTDYIRAEPHGWGKVASIAMTHFWFKFLGTMSFTLVFFFAYFYLLKNPLFPVVLMPVTVIDQFIDFQPLALPVYFSLWIYVSLPPMLMLTQREVIEYGCWIGGLCLVALLIFCFWPTAVPPANIDWDQYPGMGFLKGVDAAGNACPSLHVATAVFSGIWLHWRLPSAGGGRGSQLFNACWCLGIAYSTMATKQHVSLDVIAGIALGSMVAWLFRNRFLFISKAASGNHGRPAKLI